MRGALAAIALVALPGMARAQAGPCDAVACSDAGQCFEERGTAYCLCDEGFAAEGRGCVEADVPGDLSRERRSSALARRIVELAESQVGLGPIAVGRGLDVPHGHLWQYLSRNEWWCTDFVSWVYAAAGAPFTGGYEGGWYVPGNDAAAAWFVRNGLWVAKGGPGWDDLEPRPGDFLRFRTMRGGHSAVVVAVEGDTLHTVEGNVDGLVKRLRHERFRRHPTLDGVGRVTLPNAPPLVRTSRTAEVAAGEPLTIAAVVEDDGPLAEPALEWRLLEGPAEPQVADPTLADTEVTFPEPGRYVLELIAHDGELSAAAPLTVDVWSLPGPEPLPAGAASCQAAPTGGGPPLAPILLTLLGWARASRRPAGGRAGRSGP